MGLERTLSHSIKQWAACICMLSALLSASCSPVPTQWTAPIVGGSPTSDLPAVVALVWQGEVHCSGVATASHRIITAAHCVYGAPDPGDFLVRSGPDAMLPEREGKVAHISVHPDYPTQLLPDLAVLTLDTSAPNLPALFPNNLSIGDEVLGKEARLVAYGRTNADGETDGLKRMATVQIDSNNGQVLAWTGEDAGICSGDSGGALFVDVEGTEVLAALLTEGDPACGSWGQAQRTDPWFDWLADPAHGSVGDDDDTDNGNTGDEEEQESSEPDPQTLACSCSLKSTSVPGEWLPGLSGLLILISGFRRQPRRKSPTQRPLPS